MFSLKRSFADCSSCDLLDAESCILETNSPEDLSQVDVVFVSENPGKDEIKKEVPLIGRAGQTFRKYFNKYIKKECKWLLTNCVLCLTLDEKGNTGNPTDDTIDHCKENCFEIIRQCNPKLVVLMGTSPMKAFGLGKSGITKLRGQTFKWEDYEVLLTVHPSFVNRNRSYETKFEEDIISAANIVAFLDKPIQGPKTKGVKKTGKTGIHRYRIPDKYYTDEYRLIDIQVLNNGEVLYMFRDRENKKIYHKESDEYICYQIPSGMDARKIVPYDKLEQITVPYKEKSRLDPDITYEGDMRITAKHAMDYYHFNQGEAPKVDSNIMFFDIEVDTGRHNKSFPKPELADFPICLITTMLRGEKICYILDNGCEEITPKGDTKLKIYKSEVALMKGFIKDFRDSDPDFICGWNSIAFDLEYIFNRLPKLKIPRGSISRYNEFYVDGQRFVCNLTGCVPLDQLFLYRSFTFTKKESYKLGFIAQEELGETKIELELPINLMYYERFNTFIEYNIRDTEVIEKLEQKLKHINLLNELRMICTSSFGAASSTFGQVDCIMVSFLKGRGLASKNADPHIVKTPYPGAYVQEPIPGIYSNITDFDFTSLYPSIIMTYNIGVNNFVMRTVEPTDGYDLAYDYDSDREVDIIIDPTFENKKGKATIKQLREKAKEQNLIYTINGCFYKTHKDEMSVYSEVLGDLLSSRRAYKKKMLDAKESGDKESKNLYNTRQLVYKVLANSLYGVIANKAFRFFDVGCAAAITLGGQEALKASIIEGDAFMEHLHSKKPITHPQWTTKTEMYAAEMPERSPKYIVTGDTDSIFCCFQKFPGEKSDERIKDWCNQVQTYLNTEIMEKIVTSHNASMETNKLDLKNELIISRGLFLAKKRYVIHVTNNEGRVVDETKFMGLEVKRSDYPSKSKEFMKELIDLILKSKEATLSTWFKFINKKEREFRQLIKKGDKSIARPVSYGRELKQYKTIPQGVRAMENFNKISYQAHVPGSRGYMFRVLGVDIEKAPPEVAENYNKHMAEGGAKLDVVAIPDEEPRLPEYYIPDIKGNLKFCFEDRYQLLLAPVTEVKKQQEIMTI